MNAEEKAKRRHHHVASVNEFTGNVTECLGTPADRFCKAIAWVEANIPSNTEMYVGAYFHIDQMYPFELYRTRDNEPRANILMPENLRVRYHADRAFVETLDGQAREGHVLLRGAGDEPVWLLDWENKRVWTDNAIEHEGVHVETVWRQCVRMGQHASLKVGQSWEAQVLTAVREFRGPVATITGSINNPGQNDTLKWLLVYREEELRKLFRYMRVYHRATTSMREGASAFLGLPGYDGFLDECLTTLELNGPYTIRWREGEETEFWMQPTQGWGRKGLLAQGRFGSYMTANRYPGLAEAREVLKRAFEEGGKTTGKMAIINRHQQVVGREVNVPYAVLK